MKGLVIPKIITPKLAYLCGIIAGDGSICRDHKDFRYSLQIVGNPKDEKELYHNVIVPYFKSVFNIIPIARYFDGNTTYGIKIFSKVLIMFLTREIGLPHGKKYSKLCIPKYFLNDKALLLAFVRGVFDTDGCITFKKKYKSFPYYPVVSIASKSPEFIKEISNVLKKWDLNFYEVYNYKIYDSRFKDGFSLISRIEINGRNNFDKYMDIVGFSSPKHLDKIKNYNNSGRWI